MVEILEKFLKNLEDVENQASTLRENLYEAERELTQTEEETRKYEAEAITLDSTRECKLVELIGKEGELEFLVQKEACLNKLLSLRKEELHLEKNKVKELQDDIFAKRTEFCDKVWGFSDYISSEKRKDGHSNQKLKGEENVHEEIVQLEAKKTEIEDELNEVNTKLGVTVEQVHDANTEKEKLESFINSVDYLKLEEKLQLLVEDNKLLEKVFNTLNSVDETQKGRIENKQLEVIESSNMCTEGGVVSSRRKVSFYYEKVEKRELHSTQQHIDNSVHLSNAPSVLSSNSNKQQRDMSKSVYDYRHKVLNDVSYSGKGVASFQNENTAVILDQSSGNRIVEYPDDVRESGRCSGYSGILCNKNCYEDSDQVGFFSSGSRCLDISPKHPDFETATINERNIPCTNRVGNAHEKQLLPGTWLSNSPQVAYSIQNGLSSQCHGPHQLNSNECGIVRPPATNYFGQSYSAGENNRTYSPSFCSSQIHPMLRSHSLQRPYPEYEAPDSLHHQHTETDRRNYYEGSNSVRSKHYHTARSPRTQSALPGSSPSQDQTPHCSTWRTDQGDSAREAWPPQWHDVAPCFPPCTPGVSSEGVRGEGRWVTENWQASVPHHPVFVQDSLSNGRGWYGKQQPSVGPSHHLTSYHQWQGTGANTASVTTVRHPNNTAAGYHQQTPSEADMECNSEGSKEENKNISGYTGKWKPKVPVAKKLLGFGSTDSRNISDKMHSVPEATDLYIGKNFKY